MSRAGFSMVLAASPFVVVGCGPKEETPEVLTNPQESLPTPGSLGPGGAEATRPSGGAFGSGEENAATGEKSEMGKLMVRLGQGPESLTNSLKDAIAAEEPDWTAILEQATEYAELAKQVSQLEPPKGSADSWMTKSSEFVSMAERLKSAAESQNLTEATAAHGSISGSCMVCHREHRVMGPGGGAFRGPAAPGGQ